MKSGRQSKNIKSVANKLAEGLKTAKTFEITEEMIRSQEFKGNKVFLGKWKGIEFPQNGKVEKNVEIDQKEAEMIVKTSVSLPEGFKVSL